MNTPNISKSICKFYRETDVYIEGLAIPSEDDLERIRICIKITELFNKKSILDFGSGMGHMCEAFAQKGYKVYGVDLPSKHRTASEKRLKSKDLKVTFLSPELMVERIRDIDVVTCFDVFEHLENPIYWILQIFEVIAPEGILFFYADTHNFDDPSHFPEHYIYEPILPQLFQNIGFNVLPFYPMPRPRLRNGNLIMGDMEIQIYQKPLNVPSTYLERYRAMLHRWERNKR